MVANAQLRLPGIGMNIDGDFTGGRILDGVIQQISDGDAQQAGIGLQLRAFHRAVLADVQVVIMGDGTTEAAMLITVSRAVCWRSTCRSWEASRASARQLSVSCTRRVAARPMRSKRASWLVEAAERRRFSSAAWITASGVRNSCAHHAHKLPLVEAGFTLNLQFARQALLLLQLAVFSTHPQDGNDQHRNDMDDQRVLPEGIDRHMERDNPMDRQLHQHRGDDIERRQQTQQQGGTVDSFFAPQPPGGEQQHRGDNDEYYPSICIAKP